MAGTILVIRLGEKSPVSLCEGSLQRVRRDAEAGSHIREKIRRGKPADGSDGQIPLRRNHSDQIEIFVEGNGIL